MRSILRNCFTGGLYVGCPSVKSVFTLCLLAGWAGSDNVALAYTTALQGAGGTSVVTGVQSYNPATGQAIFRETLRIGKTTAQNIRPAVVPASRAAGAAAFLAAGVYDAATASDVHGYFKRAASDKTAADAAESAALGTLAAMSKFDPTGQGTNIGRRLSKAIDTHRRNNTEGSRDYFEIAKAEAKAGRLAEAAAAAAAAGASRDHSSAGGGYDVRPDGVYDKASGCPLYVYSVEAKGYSVHTYVSQRTGYTVQCAGMGFSKAGYTGAVPTSVEVNGKKVDFTLTEPDKNAGRADNWSLTIGSPVRVKSPSALPPQGDAEKNPKDWGRDIYDVIKENLAVNQQILQVLLDGASNSKGRPEGVVNANALSDAVSTHGSARKTMTTDLGTVVVEGNKSEAVASDSAASSPTADAKADAKADAPPMGQSGVCQSGGLLEQTWFCDVDEGEDIEVETNEGRAPPSLSVEGDACFAPLVFEIPEIGMRVEHHFDVYCKALSVLGYIVVAVAGVISIRIVSRG